MGFYDGDPEYEALRRIREDEGYKGWLDENLNKVGCPCCGKSTCTAGLTEPCNG